MSAIIKLVQGLPYFLQKPFLKQLYKRNGKSLKGYRSFYDGQFYIFNIGDHYIPAEGLSWYLDFDYYKNWVETISAYAYKPKPNDVVVDVGSGIGEELIVFSKMVGENGRVLSIEANPILTPILKTVKELNRLSNVEIFNLAINTTDTAVSISIENSSFKSGTIGSHEDNKKSYTVPGLRFDSFSKQNRLTKIDFLKVNIEGAERFLVGSIGACISRIENIAISCHDFRYESEPEKNPFFATKALVSEYLSDNGFDVISQQSGVRHIDDWVYGKRKQS